MPTISGSLKSTYAIYGPATAYAPAGWDGSQLPQPNGVVFSDAKDGAVFFYTMVNGVQYSGSALVPRYFAADGEIYPYTLTWDNVLGQASVTIKGVTYGPITAPILAADALALIIIGPDNYTTTTVGQLTLTADKTTIFVNDAVTLSGFLKNAVGVPTPNWEIRLFDTYNGVTTQIRTAITDAVGHYSMTWTAAGVGAHLLHTEANDPPIS